MAEKSGFYGDVGQAVVGDVKEAPRFSNIVQFVGGEHPAPEKFLTKLQRSAIFVKVKEVAAARGVRTYDLYNAIKLEFGVDKIEEVPLDSYKAVMALLCRSLSNDDPAIITVSDAADRAPAVCLACAEKSNINARLLRTVRLQIVALATLTVVCGWLLYQHAPAVA